MRQCSMICPFWSLHWPSCANCRSPSAARAWTGSNARQAAMRQKQKIRHRKPESRAAGWLDLSMRSMMLANISPVWSEKGHGRAISICRHGDGACRGCSEGLNQGTHALFAHDVVLVLTVVELAHGHIRFAKTHAAGDGGSGAGVELDGSRGRCHGGDVLRCDAAAGHDGN